MRWLWATAAATLALARCGGSAGAPPSVSATPTATVAATPSSTVAPAPTATTSPPPPPTVTATPAVPSSGPASPASPGSPSPPSPQPPPPSPAAPGGEVTATDANNGGAVQLRTGQTLVVTLGSTYWNFDGSSNPAILQQLGQPTVSASPGPIPGLGRGTVTARFRAVAPGAATVTAQRTSCGEALACSPDQRTYRLNVQVT